jgi:hypothetical protein
MVGVALEIKYGMPYKKTGDIRVGDVVVGENRNTLNLMEVVLITINHNSISDENPEGVIYECRDIVNDKTYHVSKDKLFLFNIDFRNRKLYNKRTVTASAGSNNNDMEYYKGMLKQYVLRKRRRNPLDVSPEGYEETPLLEKMLRTEVEYFDHETDSSLITENLLGETRVVQYDE